MGRDALHAVRATRRSRRPCQRVARLLLEGKSSADAIREVFGSIESLEGAYLEYHRKFEPALTAVQLDQRDPFPRLTLARVYWRLSRRGEAMGLARPALSLARTDQQRAQAKELITFMEANAK